MKHLFKIDSTGIPISLISTNDFQGWLKQQNQQTQNWLDCNNFNGQGVSTIPSAEGQISKVLYVISEEHDFFIAGDLALTLPPQQFILNDISDSLLSKYTNTEQLETEFAISWGLSAYKFELYKKNEDKQPCLAIASSSTYKKACSFVESVSLVRDLVNTPASDLMPEHLSLAVDKLAEKFSASTCHLIGEQLLEQNYPAIHAVGRASIHEPRLIDLQWGDIDAPKVTLVGKGVCFDSGGLDLKPSGAMRLMKKDMGGAAHVLGLAQLIMSQQLPVRLRVLIPAVENAVSSNAFRPGDVLATRQGITVEVDNTDAEGRLVLCDALTEADSESPDLILDFATLTGACRVALGTELPGFFCNKPRLAEKLLDSGLTSQDPIWQLPLHKPYKAMLKSDIADTLNSAPTGFGGAITAALYLEMFVSETTPWVHFDVMAWNNRKLPGRPIGGEAFGIRAVFDYLNKRYSN